MTGTPGAGGCRLLPVFFKPVTIQDNRSALEKWLMGGASVHRQSPAVTGSRQVGGRWLHDYCPWWLSSSGQKGILWSVGRCTDSPAAPLAPWSGGKSP